MNLKELIEEIVFDHIKFMSGIISGVSYDHKTGKCGMNFKVNINYKILATDILKAMTKHLCDKVDGMKNPRLFKDIDIPRATKFFNLALDEVKQMLRKEMG